MMPPGFDAARGASGGVSGRSPRIRVRCRGRESSGVVIGCCRSRRAWSGREPTCRVVRPGLVSCRIGQRRRGAARGRGQSRGVGWSPGRRASQDDQAVGETGTVALGVGRTGVVSRRVVNGARGARGRRPGDARLSVNRRPGSGWAWSGRVRSSGPVCTDAAAPAGSSPSAAAAGLIPNCRATCSADMNLVGQVGHDRRAVNSRCSRAFWPEVSS